MGAVSNLGNKENSQGSSKHPTKKSPENLNPSNPIIISLIFVSVLIGIAGIAFHFFKNKKTKKDLENVSN